MSKSIRKQITEFQHCICLNITGIEENHEPLKEVKPAIQRLAKCIDELMFSIAGQPVLWLDVASSRLKVANKERTKAAFIRCLLWADEALERAAKLQYATTCTHINQINTKG